MGKEVKSFANRDGQMEDYILEHGIFADLAIVKAWKADETGNLVFRKTARNFNQPAATCGKVCVVEVEEIVPTGSLDPRTSDEVMDLLIEMCAEENVTLLLVTHEDDLASRLERRFECRGLVHEVSG